MYDRIYTYQPPSPPKLTSLGHHPDGLAPSKSFYGTRPKEKPISTTIQGGVAVPSSGNVIRADYRAVWGELKVGTRIKDTTNEMEWEVAGMMVIEPGLVVEISLYRPEYSGDESE